MPSAFDRRVILHLDSDPEEESYIQYHEDSPYMAIRYFQTAAARKGFIEDPGGFVDDNRVPIDYDGNWRLYLIREESTMPTLAGTGIGPYSGFMEAVTT